MLVAIALMSQPIAHPAEQPVPPPTVITEAVKPINSKPYTPILSAISSPENLDLAASFSAKPSAAIAASASSRGQVLSTLLSPQITPPHITITGAFPEAFPPERLRVSDSSPVAEPDPVASSAVPGLDPVPPTELPTEPPTELPTEPTGEASSKPATPAINDIFEDVFGQRTAGPQQVIVPIILNDQSVGQVLVVVPGGNQVDVLVATDDFLAAIADALRPDIAAQLTAASLPNGTLDTRNIRELGISINFDSNRLELQVSIPAALRQTAVLDASSSNIPSGFDQALPPSRISGYLNLRGSQEVVWSGDAGSTGRQPLRLNFDGAINVDGWALEGSLNMTEAGSPIWQRGPISLVHDDVASAVRYQLGDLAVPVRGYQASLPMVGITVARNFSLQPYQVTRPVSRYEFFLERPSTVEVFVNGQSVQTLRLEAGSQDIRDLPLNAGTNGVQLVITDDVGRVQRLDFATGVSGDLLAPGVQQFAYSFGFPAGDDASSSSTQKYDFSQPTLTLAHRLGVTDALTLGSYFQGDLDTQMLGIEGTWATTVGNFGWDAALSLDQDHGIDGAARLYYDWLFRGATSTDSRSLRLSAEYRGANFMTVADGVPDNSTGLDLSLAYSQTLFGNARATLSGRYRFTRNEPSNAYSINWGLAKPIGDGVTLNANVGYGINDQGKAEPRLFLGISVALTRQRQFVSASTTLDGGEAFQNRLNWSYSPPVTFEGISTALTATTSDRTLSLLSQTRYRGYRADLSLDHSIHIPRENGGTTVQATRLTWGTALAFADGVWAWSRPIENSFAIIARQGTARDQVVDINPGINGAIARADALGPAVVPLSPYSFTTLIADAPGLPQGSELGESQFGVFPTYRSGTLIRVGTDATVVLRGVLVDEQGASLVLQYGRITSLTDPDWPAVELFTNRTGRFAASGLKPGQYEIWMVGRDRPLMTFDIPAGTTGVYTLPSHNVSPAH
ncbi:MAG: fimbrial biogenesis outer membrane usher protein [Oscillatoriophycideae cyanobacterium NC_groundwater_1537_Pr4_S-0.65um_50_18]|nr:fimbrial biogenesis outer membrane usher protein [Oscillatoriophycideae cyanobacterium NC_groundwater_1537_Pr4_S-0.65um_50_18]